LTQTCYNEYINGSKSLKEDYKMRKISKSKKGFTLVEMIIVIAIVVILAAVVFFAFNEYIIRGQQAASSISAEHESMCSILDVADGAMAGAT